MDSLLLEPSDIHEIDPRSWLEWYETLTDQEKETIAQQGQSWERVAPI